MAERAVAEDKPADYYAKFTSIEDAAAEELVNFDGDEIDLQSLSELSQNAACGLAKCEAGLLLQGLTSLAAEAAIELAKHKGAGIALDGLSDLPDVVADALANYQGILSLNGLQALSAVAARSLGCRKANITHLNGLLELPDAVAEGISAGEGAIALEGLKKLSDVAAASLAKHKGNIYLESLEQLDNSPGHLALAKKLAEDHDLLALDSLRSISDQAAEFLGAHSGENLSLDGLQIISDKAAASLARHKGMLSMKSIQRLDDSPGHLALAKKLAKDHDLLALDLLRSISDQAAEFLGAHSGENLSLDGLQIISDKAAASLARHKGMLSMKSIQRLDDSPGHLALAKKLAEDDLGRCAPLNMDCLTSLTPAVAEELAKCQANLSLGGIVTIESDAANALAQHVGIGYGLKLNGLKTCTDAAIAALSGHRGPLSLDGLEQLSEAGARSLSKLEGTLSLNGLKTISDESAEALGMHSGDPLRGTGTLYLNGITKLSDKAAQYLSAHKGQLHLAGLKELSPAAIESFAERSDEAFYSGDFSGKVGELGLVSLDNLSSRARLALKKRVRDLRKLSRANKS